MSTTLLLTLALWMSSLARVKPPIEGWIEGVRSFDGKVSENLAIKLLGFLDKRFVRMSCGGLSLGTEISGKDLMAAVGPVKDQVIRRYI
ncbi:hypothetical protein VTO58DRAFT_110275 [Aureobasidium pullulans]